MIKSKKRLLLNWLSHIFLSEYNIEFQIGNYLSDPLKGKAWPNASEDIKNGINLHKIIDGFCDRNEHFVNSKNKLKEKGLLRGVAVDIIYDYLLTKNWDLYSNIPFKTFTYDFYKQSHIQSKKYPQNAVIKLERISKYKLLNAYTNLENVVATYESIDRRLSPRLLKRDTLLSYKSTTYENINEIEKDFLEFFPIMCQEVKKHTNTQRLSHWKI